MQDEVIDNVVEYVDRLRNYTTTNISSIQAGMIPEVLDIHWKTSPYYLVDGVKKYVFGKKEYVIQINGLRFKNNLPKRKNMVWHMPFKDAVDKQLINPCIFFVNGLFIKWSDITLVRDLKYTYLDIKNNFDVSVIDPIKIDDVQVIHIPFNIQYTEKRNPITATELFRFDSRSGHLLNYGDCVYYTTLDNIKYKEFQNLAGATIKDVDLNFDKNYKLTPVNFICFVNGKISTTTKPTIKNLNLITINDGNPIENDLVVKFFYRDVTNHNRSNITIPPNDGVLKKAIIDNDRPQLDIVNLEKDFDFNYRQDMLYSENTNKGIRYIARYNDAFFDDLYYRKMNIRTDRYTGGELKKLISARRMIIKAHDEVKTEEKQVFDHNERIVKSNQLFENYKTINGSKDFKTDGWVIDTVAEKTSQLKSFYEVKLSRSEPSSASQYKHVTLTNLSGYLTLNNTFNLTDTYENKILTIAVPMIGYNSNYPEQESGFTQYTKVIFTDEFKSALKNIINSYDISKFSVSDKDIKIRLEITNIKDGTTEPTGNITDFWFNLNELVTILSTDDSYYKFKVKTGKSFGTDFVLFGENEIADSTYKNYALTNYIYNTVIPDEAIITGPYRINTVYRTETKTTTVHVPESLSAPEVVMPSGLHDRLDGYVLVFKNGLLWDKYSRIKYQNDNFIIGLTEDEFKEIEDYDEFEVVHFDRCNNNYLTVDITEDNNTIENTTIPYKDLIVLANYNKRHIYYDYLKFSKRSVYDVPFKIDEDKKTITFTDSDYYGKTIYMASQRQFHYCFYNVSEPQVMFYLTKEFCCAKDKSRYLFFINGRMISQNMYHLIIQDPDNAVTEPVIHSRILCKAGDKVEIVYIPDAPQYLNIGGNNKASIVNVKATIDGQATFSIPIPTRKYNITKDNFFVMKGSVIVEQDRYNVIGTSLVFKEKEDYIEYGRELTFVFLYNELIEENPYGTIKEEDMLNVSVTTTYAETDAQTTFEIVYPYNNFDTSQGYMFVTYRGIFVNPRRYDVIERNHTITFKDANIGIDVGTAVSYVWVYPTEKHKLNSYIVRAEATKQGQTQFNIPVPYANYFKDQNKFLVTRNGIFLNESDYAIDKNKNILTLTSIDGLDIGQELVFNFFTGSELSVKTDQIKVTATEDNQMVFQVPEIFHDVKNIDSKFFIVIGDTFIDPRRYVVNGSTIRFINEDDAMPAGKSFFFTFTYIEEIDSATAIIGDVHDGSKYTNITAYTVDATSDNQMVFNIPVENAAIYNKQFFVTVGSTFINETNYTLNKVNNTLTFKDGTVDIIKGRHVYFTFIDSEYAVIEKDVRVVQAEATGQLEVDIPVPFENFFELGNNCLVYINNVYFDPSRYTIKDNVLSIKDTSDGLVRGEDVVFMFLYVSNSQNTSYTEDDVQMPKLTEYGYIYLSNKEIRHSMNNKFFFLFLNGKKIEQKDILMIANNIIRITKDPVTNFNPVIMDFTPSIPELDKYKQITSDFDLIMNKATKDDINDMYNEYTTVTDIEPHIVPNTTQEAIINNIIAEHYIANAISFGQPFVYTYDTNTIEHSNFSDLQNITQRYVEGGVYDFTVPDGVTMLSINSASSSSVAEPAKEDLTHNLTKVNLPNGNFIIPQSLRIQFRNIDKVLYSASNTHDKGYSAAEPGYAKSFNPAPGSFGIPTDNRKFKGRLIIKTMNVLPGSTYRITTPKKGFVMVGYYTNGTVVDVDFDSGTMLSQNFTFKINSVQHTITDATLSPEFSQDFSSEGTHEFIVPSNVSQIIVSMCSGFETIRSYDDSTDIEIPDIAAIQLSAYNGVEFSIPDVPQMSTEEKIPVRNIIKRLNGVVSYDISQFDEIKNGVEVYPYSNGDLFGNGKFTINTVRNSDKYALTDHGIDAKYEEQFTNLVKTGLTISVARPKTAVYKSTSIVVRPGDKLSIYIDKSYSDEYLTSGAVTITYKNTKQIEAKDFYVMNTMDATKYKHPALDFSNNNAFEVKKDEIDTSASTDEPMDEDILEKDHPTFIGSDRPKAISSLSEDETLFIHTKKDSVE